MAQLLRPHEGRQALYRLIELAKPGSGWVQFTEGSLEHLTPEQRKQYPVLARFQTLVAEMLPHFRWNPRPGKLVRQWLEEYGLEEVQEKVMEIPIGAGNKDPKLGEMAKQNMLEVVANFRTAATRLPDGTGIHAEDFDPILRDIKVEFETVGGILRFNTVWGRRP
ncbi:hypothetical protein CNMCM8980_004523 [Aspergillus fumigatiaffinis]|nr:hypothetical protein CNMCM8980_004523 [Aspergillus fumigatiaffinis]